MTVELVQISVNGRIVVPAAFRKAMGLKGGETLALSMDEDGLHLQSRRQMLLQTQAAVRKFVPEGVSLVDELIEERRREAKREQGSL